MDKKKISIAFSNQKGGVGKSMFSTLFTSMVHYELGRNVLLVDCDYPQYSIKTMRERDMEVVSGSDAYKRMLMGQYERIQKKAYPVLTASPAQSVEVAVKFMEESPDSFDVVVYDLPGTVNSDGVLKSLLSFDYMFCPIVSDRMVMQSSLTFVATLQEIIRCNPQVNLKNIYIFWNKVVKRENRELYNHYSDIMAKLQLEVLKTEVPQTIRYKKEMPVSSSPFFRSTLFPPDKSLMKESKIDLLVDEICQIIKL